MDDEVTARSADLETAGGAGNRVGVGAGDEQAAARGAEGEVDDAEGQTLAGSRRRDLERAQRRGGGLRLRCGQIVIGGGHTGARAGQAGVGSGGEPREDERRGGGRRGQPVEVGAIGEDRAAGAEDAVGKAGGGGDRHLGVGGRGDEQRAGVGSRAKGQGTQGQSGERGAAREHGDRAARLIDRDVAKGLRDVEAGQTAQGEITRGERESRGGVEQRGERAGAREIEFERATLDRRGAGVGAGGARTQDEVADADLGDGDATGNRAGEDGVGIGAADGDGRGGSAGRRVEHGTGARERTDGLRGAVDVERGP